MKMNLRECYQNWTDKKTDVNAFKIPENPISQMTFGYSRGHILSGVFESHIGPLSHLCEHLNYGHVERTSLLDASFCECFELAEWKYNESEVLCLFAY